MAKRLVKWTLDGSILKVSKTVENTDHAEVEISASFDLKELFPTFATLKEVPRQLIVYGTKQKLMDTGADQKGSAEGKIDAAKIKWQELLDGKWSGDRVNATGAAAAKKTTAAVKEIAKAVTLEGLVMKKALSGIEGNEPFTDEDQAKLDEFLAVAAKHAAKK